MFPFVHGIVGSQAGGILLPRWLETDNGTLLDAFGDEADYTIANGTKENNVTEFVVDGNAVKVTTNGTTAGLNLEKAVSWGFGGVAPARVRWYFYLHDANADSVQIRMYTSSTAFFQVVISSVTNGYGPGWNAAELFPAQWTVGSGTPSWASDVVKVMYRVGAKSGGVTTRVTFGALYNGMENYTAAIISFDDSWASDYTIALAKMQPLGIPGTTYTEEARIDMADRLTSVQLQEMDAASWCVGTHGGGNWTGAINATADAEIASCISFLQGIGITEGWKHASYPGGSYDYYAINRLQNNGIVTGRLANRSFVANSFVARENAGGYMVAAQQISVATNQATWEGYVDSAIANRRVLWLFFHQIVESGATGGQTNRAAFEAIIDYIVASGLPVITPMQLHASIAGPVQL